MSPLSDKNSMIVRAINDQFDDGKKPLAIFVCYIREDGSGHSILDVHEDVEYVPDPGTESVSIEVAFLRSIADSINDQLTRKETN